MRKALAWAAISAAACLYWTITSSFPAGTNDLPNNLSLLRHVPANTLGMIFTVAMLGLVVMLLAAQRRPGRPNPLSLAAGWTAVAALLLVVPDARLLTLAGYAPMLILSAPFGWLGKIDYSQVFNLPLAWQVWCVIGGVLLAQTLLAWRPLTWRPSARLARTATYVAA
ncbi:MAG TPA: hypothetical protein VF062_21070, partial [Candidatus Limnocylindrales bacterium]